MPLEPRLWPFVQVARRVEGGDRGTLVAFRTTVAGAPVARFGVPLIS